MRGLFTCLCLAAVLWGQTGRTEISGVVRDQQDQSPLEGANVILSGGALRQLVGAATDARGVYRIPDVPPGRYQLRVTYIGYRPVERQVVIPSGADVMLEINIDLEVESIQLRGYVVTASRGRREKLTDAPAATIVMSAAEIGRSTLPNLGDYFKQFKGVDFTASGIDAFNLSARGFNTSFSSRLMTLVDGRKANVPSLRLIAYNAIPITADDVDQIEVVLGPSSALYGPEAYAGVANIITKKPALSQGGKVSLSVGNRDLRKWQLRYAGARGKWGYKLSYVDFSATDWHWVDPEEKKSHHKFWIEDDGKLGEQLDSHAFRYDWTWDGYDIRFDRNGNGKFFDPEDSVSYAVNDIIADVNHDGLVDTADFKLENQRLDLRLDYDFGPDHNFIVSIGQAVASNINITGPARFLADHWIYRYYQARYVRGSFFTQAYLNTSNAGWTRNLRTGERIFDQSTFFHLQMQFTARLPQLWDTQLTSGFDYQRTMPRTFGTVLPDGTGVPNPKSYDDDGLDNDHDGRIDEFAEGLITTNEYGLYFQSSSSLTPQLNLIIASRLDLHSGVRSEDGFTFLADPLLGGTVRYRPQFSPKVGLLWKPDENQTFRLTAARAFNTPSSQGLFLRMRVATKPPFRVMARGNHAGFHYTRDPEGNLMMYDLRPGSSSAFRLAKVPPEAVLHIPAFLGRPAQWFQPEDLQTIEPVISEDLWTYELGYVGVLGNRIRATLDVYYSQYSDFVSDLTLITPLVMDTSKGLAEAERLGLVGTSEHDGIDIGPDNLPGTEDDSVITDLSSDDHIEIILTNVNYGRISIGGLDLSIGYLFSPRLWSEVRYSYLGRQAFYNRLTRSYDPINAPRYKLSVGTTYTSRHNRFWLGLTVRHIPTFDWAVGAFVGTIPRYTVADLNWGFRFNDRYSFKMMVNNLNNDVHREIIGGAELGRQIILNLSLKLE
ncbi:MAG: TonB-dependent receptor [Candidatus Neomarinimicrobiota bacterium]